MLLVTNIFDLGLRAGTKQHQTLREILENIPSFVKEVRCAVAFVSTDVGIFEMCHKRNLKLTVWARYGHELPVSSAVMAKFLNLYSENQKLRFVRNSFHAKAIWWADYGVYIGSANLTDTAWNTGMECGVFLTEQELHDQGLAGMLEEFFSTIDENSYPLTKEILEETVKFENDRDAFLERQKIEFEKSPQLPKVASMYSVTKVSAASKGKAEFLREWSETLQILRNISDRISSDQYRPNWVPADTHKGVQVDQFLHAYYFNQVRRGAEHPFAEFHEKNRLNPEQALIDAMIWWGSLERAPGDEDRFILDWAPYLRKNLAEMELKTISFENFDGVCERAHAIREHSRRVRNEELGLDSDAAPKSSAECIHLLAQLLWGSETSAGKTVIDVLVFVLYGGPTCEIPNRLWLACEAPEWRIPHLGLSSLGELVGWALPDVFPPRNGRTSKALCALGYDVKIHHK